MIVLAGPFFYRYRIFLCVAVLLAGFSSCTIIKEHPGRPLDQPFVYETKVEVQSDLLETDDKKDLASQLKNQVHDSIRVRTVQKILGWEKGLPRMFYSVMENPPFYDSLHADKSVLYMEGLLHSLGYYRDSINYETSIKQVKDQQRVTVQFNVFPGKQFRIDSIAYRFNDTLGNLSAATKDTLQKITNEAMPQAFIKKGSPFAIPLIASERDRLADLYRNKGYLLFSSEELLIVWDTVGLALLQPTLDPLEQLEILRRKRENPTADIEVRLRTNPDTSHMRRFYVGNITIYPDLTSDTTNLRRRVRQYDHLRIISYQNMFKSKILAENIYMQRGEMYTQRNYLRTLNRFNSIGSWRLVTIDQVPRADEDTVDFVVKLTPALKYVIAPSIGGSRNWEGNPLTRGTLVGVSLVLQNRNFARAANQSTTSLRFGTEVASGSVANTTQASISHTIQFPRAIPKFEFLKKKENIRTSLGFSASYINRVDFLRLTTINGSWGYEFTKKKVLYNFRWPNVEFTNLERRKFLTDLIDSNKSYRYIFHDGLVISTMVGLTKAGGNTQLSNVLRVNAEASGIPGFFRKLSTGDTTLFQFVKLDLNFTQTFHGFRSSFVWRIFGGAGIGIPFDDLDSSNRSLPFFKSYYAGGANSMRAWQLRKLGPGSAIKSFGRKQFPDRFGDIQFELNAEYRWRLTTIKGVGINLAAYTDVGNIWYLRDNPTFEDDSEVFKPSKFFRDLAIGAGTGVRIDFGIFLIRLDYAYKIRDPSPDDPALQYKWFPEWKLLGGQLQLGVTYPF